MVTLKDFKKQMKEKVNWLPHESELVINFMLHGSAGTELNSVNFCRAVVEYQESKKRGRTLLKLNDVASFC
jgi:hypothetical protein